MFLISFICHYLDSHSDGTHSLQKTHWWASNVTLNFFKSIVIRIKLIYIMSGMNVKKLKKTIKKIGDYYCIIINK